MHQDKWTEQKFYKQVTEVRSQEYNLRTMTRKTKESMLGTEIDNSDRPLQEGRQQEKALHDLQEELNISIPERIIELVEVNEALQAEIAELKRSEQLAQSQTKVLNRTLNRLAAEPDLDKFLDQLLIAITEQLAVSFCVVWLYKPETEICFPQKICSQEQILTGAELLAHANALTPHVSRQHPICLKEFRASYPIDINDIVNCSHLEPYEREYLTALGIQGLLEVPLILNQEVIGCLAAYNTERERFTMAEIELAQALTYQVTLAIQLTRLAEKAKQEAQQSAVLKERNRLAHELHSSLKHLQEVLAAPNNGDAFDNANDVVKANCSEAQGYLLQDTLIEKSAQAIRSISQGNTQSEPNIQEKMIANVPVSEDNNLDKLPSGLLKLSDREQEILRIVATGANNREIAEVLCLSLGTVRNHISNILRRLNVRDRTQAALIAHRHLQNRNVLS